MTPPYSISSAGWNQTTVPLATHRIQSPQQPKTPKGATMSDFLTRFLILYPCTYFIIALAAHILLGWTVFPFSLFV